MTKETFNSLCNKFANPDLPEGEKWKDLKYFTTEGQMEPLDFGYYFDMNMGYFIDDDTIGTGFLILEYPYAEFGVCYRDHSHATKKIATFIGLDMVNAVSFRVKDENKAHQIITNA
jgi:hypothetical protein